MRDEVDLSLTIPSKLLGKRDREQKNCEEEKNKNKKS
jgi:endoribonuclease Dicer